MAARSHSPPTQVTPCRSAKRPSRSRAKAKTLVGPQLKAGDKAPDFKCLSGLAPVTLADTPAKARLFSVVPSLDTPVCSTQTKKFDDGLAALGDKVACYTVSLDLPFAQKRFCTAEGVKTMQTLSDVHNHCFGRTTACCSKGCRSPLLARAVFVVDAGGTVHVRRVRAGSDERAELRRRPGRAEGRGGVIVFGTGNAVTGWVRVHPVTAFPVPFRPGHHRKLYMTKRCWRPTCPVGRPGRSASGSRRRTGASSRRSTSACLVRWKLSDHVDLLPHVPPGPAGRVAADRRCRPRCTGRRVVFASQKLWYCSPHRQPLRRVQVQVDVQVVDVLPADQVDPAQVVVAEREQLVEGVRLPGAAGRRRWRSRSTATRSGSTAPFLKW